MKGIRKAHLEKYSMNQISKLMLEGQINTKTEKLTQIWFKV